MDDAVPTPESTALAGRIDEVRRRLARACERAGRAPESVQLIAVGKTHPAAALLAAHHAGLRVFGENRVQEAAGKAPQLPADVEWHLIGPLQTNKARLAAETFSVVHSVDRPKVALALDAAAARLDKVIPCFVEVNLGGEESKHGFAPANLAAELAPLARLAHLRLLGLMAIPPLGGDAEASRPWFAKLRGLRDELLASGALPGFGGQLSMGMSGDFEVAIEEGATHVRVGTAIFGERGS